MRGMLITVLLLGLMLSGCGASSSNGGSSDTEVKLLAVKPTGFPSSSKLVTMVTPVAKQPKASRNGL